MDNINFDLLNSYAEDALKKFDMEQICRVERFQVSENVTYMLKNKITNTKMAVLRISRPGYHTLDELNAEVIWVREIKKNTPVQVATPICGKNGAFVQALYTKDDKKPYFGVLYEFLEGKTPDETDAQKEFEFLGETTAWLHRHSRSWRESNSLCRGIMDYDTLIGNHPMWGRWQDAEDLQQDGKDILQRASATIKKRLVRFGKSHRRFGLIHADLRLSNLLIDGAEVKIIDFDDCGFSWYLHDLAGAVSFIEDKPMTQSLIEAWLTGYCGIEKMDKEELMEIPTFIMQRRLQLLAWLTSHKGSDPAKELSVGFADRTVGLAEKYLRTFT